MFCLKQVSEFACILFLFLDSIFSLAINFCWILKWRLSAPSFPERYFLRRRNRENHLIWEATHLKSNERVVHSTLLLLLLL